MLLRLNFGALGVILAKKVFQKMLRKRGSRLVGNEGLLPCKEAPGQAATIKNWSSKKQLFEHKLKHLFEFLLEKCGLS